jgi:hypothetical protein
MTVHRHNAQCCKLTAGFLTGNCEPAVEKFFDWHPIGKYLSANLCDFRQ